MIIQNNKVKFICVLHQNSKPFGFFAKFSFSLVQKAYLTPKKDFCKELGRVPEKPFSGKRMLRLPPEIHEREADKKFVKMLEYTIPTDKVLYPVAIKIIRARRLAYGESIIA